MRIEKRDINNVTILDIVGEFGDETDTEEFARALPKSPAPVVLNLSQVHSLGKHAFAWINTAIMQVRIPMVLAALTLNSTH